MRREVESLRAERAPQVAPTKTMVAPTATAVPAPKFIIQSLSAGYGHVCALRETGLAECWGDYGYGDYGQLDAPSNERFVSIAASRISTCGLREDGTVVCWGSNDEGQSSPPRDERFTSITAGSWDHYCGLREDGTAVCWGSNVIWGVKPAERQIRIHRRWGGHHLRTTSRRQGDMLGGLELPTKTYTRGACLESTR